MLRKKTALLGIVFGLCAGVSLGATKPVELKSPDGKILLSLDFSDKINYTVTCEDELLLKDCHLQMTNNSCQ